MAEVGSSTYQRESSYPPQSPSESPSRKRQRLSPSPDMNGHANAPVKPPPDQSRYAPPTDVPRLEPSFIGAEPYDAFTKEIMDWMLEMIRGQENIEVEAKIGVLIDTKTKARLQLPILTETILSRSIEHIRFESNMTENQHKHYNMLLNKRCADFAIPRPTLHMKYAHTRSIDSFYNGPGGSKIRVSRDTKTGEVLETVTKIRLADLNIYNPKGGFDWRISVNREIPAQPPPPDVPSNHARNKDRVSYTHQACRFDLTQVHGHPPDKDNSLMHELEVEFANPAALIREAMRKTREEPTAYDEMVQVFINNVRILIRSGAPP